MGRRRIAEVIGSAGSGRSDHIAIRVSVCSGRVAEVICFAGRRGTCYPAIRIPVCRHGIPEIIGTGGC